MNPKICTRFSGFSVILIDNLSLSDLLIFFLKSGTVSHICLKIACSVPISLAQLMNMKIDWASIVDGTPLLGV